MLAEVHPHHAQQGMDGDRVGAGGKRLFGKHAGFYKSAHARGRESFTKGGGFAAARGDCGLTLHDLPKSSFVNTLQPACSKKKGAAAKAVAPSSMNSSTLRS
jgi:hypothetical protein